MILKWMSLGIPVAGFFAAGVIASQAETPPAPKPAPAAKAAVNEESGAGQKVVKLRVVKGESEDGAQEKETVVVLDGEEIALDVEVAVEEAIAGARKALEEAEAEIRVELDGKKLEAMTEKHRAALERARERLEGLGESIAERAAQVEVRVTRAVEKAAAAAEKAGEALKEHRVIVVREGGADATVEIEKGEDGHTVVVIEGEDIKVITRQKDGEQDKKGAPGK